MSAPFADSEKVVSHLHGPHFVKRRELLLGCAAFGLAACSSRPNLVGIAPNRTLTDEELERRSHRIFIATVRRPSDVAGEFFSGQRARKLSFAAVDVVIPPSHKPGRIERPWRSRPDPDRHFVITNPRILETDESFISTVEDTVLELPKGKRTALLWIHGYNTNLTLAVLRFAQFVEDTGYQGVPILYSWASQARLGGYVYDLNSALIARDNVEDIPALLQGSPVEVLDIVAHSMGNLVAMEAARGVAKQGLFNASGKLRSVILASPDIDIDLFIAQLSVIPKSERNFYILTSSDDQALAVSMAIARNPRVGQLEAKALADLGLNVIDLSEVDDTSSINHSKFADAPDVVKHLGERILAGDAKRRGASRTEAIIVGASGAITVVDEAVN